MHPSTILFFINLFFILFVSGFTAGSSSTTMTIANRCSIKVYPGILHVAGTSVPFTTGFSLQPGESKVLTMSDSWWGKLWGRTYCSTDSKGMFTCLTGECASSTMECDGRDSTSPVTFAEFNLNTNSNGFDYFGVSVVNGYNLPMMVQPQVGGGCGDCLMTSYATDTFHGVCVSTNYLVTFCPISDHSRGQKKRGSTRNNIIKALGIAAAALVGIGAGIGAGIIIIRKINKIKQCCSFNCFNCCNGGN